jgi:hypothetical protein
MYNRYIPNPDGSYQRNRVQEHRRVQSGVKPSPPPPPSPPVDHHPPDFSPPQAHSISGFLRQLLPKDFDTGDLIVILLLLLMAGDSQEERNRALLTIALYFIL